MFDADVCHRGMNETAQVDQYHRLEHDEDAARQYLLSLCWPESEPLCPRCLNTKIYTLSGDRLRCSGCRYTFQPFSGRWLNNGALSAADWIRLTRMFVEEMTPHQIKNEMGMSYNTVYKGLTVIRFAILAHAADAAQLISPATGLDSYIKGKRLTGAPTSMRMDTIPVYGILRQGDMVFVDLLPGFQAETVFHFHMSFHLRLKRTGNLVYTDKYRDYDAMMLCGNETLPYGVIKKSDSPPFIDESDKDFWPAAKRALKRFRGISCQRFPLYLKELEFRFNNRDRDLLPILLTYLCDLVPDPQ